MNILKIKPVTIENGDGCRVSVFVAGCDVHCSNCIQPETWNPDQGEYLSMAKMQEIMKLLEPDYVKGLSILGGDPMAEYNWMGTETLAYLVKYLYHDKKDVWVYTGHLYEECPERVLKYVDVLVDGPYKEELRDPSLPYRGSSNQRIIDVQASLKQGGVVLRE